ncbi:cysteine proteinase [Gonapodya prolifera JEL478]|uniref:ubiquitinyl hydrolase 1 n=1 Tax=Gonapodya prolifera (strain JEL478) TaxID=1344416 RepID=A0A139ALV8_GONPJ|nr:cysteine proteinase [Gonapodya prolifera JEL478]|eukprot:KXS17767.1 cysteine proteinase [Gonapodya prolifera JEL478]
MASSDPPRDPHPPTTDERPTDQQILDYENSLRAELLADAPFVSELAGLEELEKEYEGGAEIFRKKLQELKKDYPIYRSIRKDGNCFYRAFGWRLAELLWSPSSASSFWHDTAKAVLISTRELLTSSGYEQVMIEDFYDTFLAAMKLREAPGEPTGLEVFQSEYASSTTICHLRLCTGAELKRSRDLYEGFAEMPIDEFVIKSVEPMALEADNLQISALVNAIPLVNIRIANLDTTPGSINFHEFSPMDADAKTLPVITLLFRPGHYDVLYGKNENVEK